MMTARDPSTVATPPPVGPTPAERYADLRADARASLDEFLGAVGPLTPAEAAAVFRVELEARWREGDRVPAEHFLARLPGPDPEAAADVIFCEFLLREEFGERPDAEEFARRFPEQAGVIRDQIALHRAIDWQPAITHTNLEDPDGTRTFSVGIPDPTPAPPTRPDSHGGALPRPFDRYTLLEVLGKGGMGVVYLAEDSRLGRRVALKLLRPDISPLAAARFAQEARLAAALSHPNLCPVFDVGRVGCVDFFTMPHLTGGSLAGRIRGGGALPPAEAARIVRRVAEAMVVAHAAGIVHRDLKPANVLLDDRSEPVVTDFGLARKVAGDDPRLTRSGATVGTPAYLPPEQVGAAPEAVGPAADIYSLGVVLHELLTGRLPFQGTPGEVLRKVLADEPPPAHRIRPGLDRRLSAICKNAMAKDPNRRFPSMAALAEALADWERNARSPGRKWAVGVGVVAVCGAAAILIVRHGPTPATVAVPSVADPAPHPPNPAPPSEVPKAPDMLTAGSHWEGTFRFSPNDVDRPVALTVTERTDDRFLGEYRAEGDYAWEVEGTVRGERVRWKLGKALTEPAAGTTASGRAVVSGTLIDKKIRARFSDPSDGSRADMTLTLRQ